MTGPGEAAVVPPLDAILVVDPAVLAGALRSIPDGDNAILRLADGHRSVKDVIARSGLDVPLALAALERLLDAGVLRVVPPGSPSAPEGHPGTERADWFADPELTSQDGPRSGRAGKADPGPRGRMRAWALVAAIALAAVLLGGAIWARRQGLRPPGPAPSRADRAERPAPGQTPPALSVTEPAPRR